MARTGDTANTTTDRLSVSSVPIAANWSAFFWGTFTNAPTGAFVQIAFHHAGGTFDLAFTHDHPSAGFRNAWGWRNTAGTYYTAQISPGTGTWRAIGASFDGSNLRAYMDTNAPVTTAVSGSQATGSQPMALLNNVNGSNIHNCEGSIAYVAYWNLLLTDDDFVSLGKKMHPRLIQPKGLVIAPDLAGLNSPEPDPIFGSSWTISGSLGVVDSPPIILPRRPVVGFTGTSPPPSTYIGARYKMIGAQQFSGGRAA